MCQSTVQAKIFQTNSLDPYRNIAVEDYFLKHVGTDEIILYLWSNERTVVIGRNQNIWKECNVEALLSDGGHPVRRLSGGGAVYHDSGNLNFTFIAKRGLYDKTRQTKVILNAMRMLGFDAELTGRNDLCIDGRKFSGHSYHRDGDSFFHNGTILIRTDADAMKKYLTPSREKLDSKSVSSVKSRTVNLSELSPDISLNEVIKALEASFSDEYGNALSIHDTDDFIKEDLEAIECKFRSAEWTFNEAATFKDIWRHRYEWGEVELQMLIIDGIIRDCIPYTDALNTELPEQIRKSLIGNRYSPSDIEKVLCSLE